MISFSEFLAWYSDDGMTKNLMKVYDADKNGSLNLAEFTCLARVSLPSPHLLLLSTRSTCLPGLIRTPMMFAQDWKLDEAIAKKVFKKYDKDKDGELNMAELKVVVEKTKS